MTNRSTATNHDDYIADFPPETQKVLQEVRALVKQHAPDAVETMSYAIPTFDINGKHLVHYAGYAKHLGFYPTSRGITAFKEEISGYKNSTGAVQFPLGEPLPTDLIRRMVEFRIEEVESKTKKK